MKAFPIPPRLKFAAVSVVVLPLLLSGCGTDSHAEKSPAAPTPPVVSVMTVQTTAVPVVTELPGRLESTRVAQIRARVAGIVEKRVFEEGSNVSAGETLLLIDPAPYQAALDSAKASLAKAIAVRNQAQAQLDRYKPLFEANAISKQDFVNQQATQGQAAAEVAVAQAAVKTATLNLGYATVVSPISGRIGRALVTEGALVGQGDSTELAVVQQIDPLYVNFTQSTSEVLQLKREISDGRLRTATGSAASTIKLILDDGTEYPYAGKLLFSDLSVDESTGEVTMRAQIPNPEHLLLPGMYVRVKKLEATATKAILVPQQAVTRGSTGDTLMVVVGEGSVETRPVKVGAAHENNWMIMSGLNPGEQVIVEGFQKITADQQVRTIPWQGAGTGKIQQHTGGAASSVRGPAPAGAEIPAPALAGGTKQE